MKRKLSTPQILFIAFFVATIVTFSDSVINWDKRIPTGIFVFITTIIGAVISKMFFRDKV